MTFYQELQLSSTGSKNLIKTTTDPKERRRHILIYNFKVYLVMAFCFFTVTAFSAVFGSQNSVAGVVVLLALLVLPALLINLSCIFLLMLLGCHNVIMYNHSTFVLGYLLLLGYDVTGKAYQMRVISLLFGMCLCMAVFYKNQKNRPYHRTFFDLFHEFTLFSARNRWYIKLTFIVSGAIFIVSLLGLPRAMWAGIACMSVCLPFSADSRQRAQKRGAFNIVGCLFFIILYHVLPTSLYPYIGVIGGIGVGYSAGYSWQTVFNTFGALSIASGLFGMRTAVLLRIVLNVFGSAYTIICDKLFDRLFNLLSTMSRQNTMEVS